MRRSSPAPPSGVSGASLTPSLLQEDRPAQPSPSRPSRSSCADARPASPASEPSWALRPCRREHQQQALRPQQASEFEASGLREFWAPQVPQPLSFRPSASGPSASPLPEAEQELRVQVPAQVGQVPQAQLGQAVERWPEAARRVAAECQESPQVVRQAVAEEQQAPDGEIISTIRAITNMIDEGQISSMVGAEYQHPYPSCWRTSVITLAPFADHHSGPPV